MNWITSEVPPVRFADLHGGTALITGASQGIGKATAQLLLENGVRVFGLSRSGGGPEHPAFTALSADLSDLDALSLAMDQLRKETTTLDYLVNVAGADPKHPIDEITQREWDQLVDLNLRSFYFTIKEALPLLRKGQGRSIVNVSSINYRLGIPGRAPYSATKAGILGLTTGLSRELGREAIRINTISPGWIFTERQVSEYFATPEAERHLATLHERQAYPLQISAEDIANHIAFYLSQTSRATTGHNAVVDGGWLLE